ncbi:MAG: DUF4124 domain-containing protein [Gammaproteobacteria bacterium]|nr:DUF4124 domain-containing protein [Gammaproteobacteria bacterium]
MKRILPLLLLITVSFAAHAGIYKWVDENGEVIYSDKPRTDNMKEHVPPALQVTPAIKPKPKAEKPLEEQPAVTAYTDFTITSPANDETIRNTAGNFSVKLALKPALDTKAGHYINLQIDGKTRVAKTSKLAINLKFIDRGSHAISAEIRSAKGKLLKTSNSVTIHMHRTSALHKAPNKAPTP